MVEETAMASERLLIMKGVDETFWQRIKDRLAGLEVDRDAGPRNIWDVRDRGSVDDKIYLWGRDGWREGFWHAVVCLSGEDVWMERGDDSRAENLVTSRRRFAVVIEPLLHTEIDHGETAEHPGGSQ